jgi:hypothetical protein
MGEVGRDCALTGERDRDPHELTAGNTYRYPLAGASLRTSLARKHTYDDA